jgi:hypothetical protein
MMVMASSPFSTTKSSDRYYSRFCMENKANFWKIFAYNYKPTAEFKGTKNLLTYFFNFSIDLSILNFDK